MGTEKVCKADGNAKSRAAEIAARGINSPAEFIGFGLRALEDVAREAVTPQHARSLQGGIRGVVLIARNQEAVREMYGMLNQPTEDEQKQAREEVVCKLEDRISQLNEQLEAAREDLRKLAG